MRKVIDRKKIVQKGIVKKNSKKKGVNIKGVLVLFLLIAVVGYLIYFFLLFASIKSVNPLLGTSSSYLLSKRTGDLDKTLIVFEEGKDEKRRISDIYLVLKNKQKDIAMLIYLPGDIYFSGVEEEFGSPIPISSLRYAGDYLQENRGVEYALWQLSQLLGTKFNNYIWLSSESMDIFKKLSGDMNEVSESSKEVYKSDPDIKLSNSFLKLHTLSSKLNALKMFVNPSLVANLKDTIYSNMGFVNVYRTIDGYDSVVKKSPTYTIDASNPKYLKDLMSERGGSITTLSSDSFDLSFRDFYSKVIDRSLEEERVRIEVYNGSGIGGSAFQLGRKIENSGCDVVRYGNAPKNIQKSVVYIPKPEEFKNSFEVVKEIIPGSFDVVNGRPDFMTTGDIVIMLGEDIRLMYQF